MTSFPTRSCLIRNTRGINHGASGKSDGHPDENPGKTLGKCDADESDAGNESADDDKRPVRDARQEERQGQCSQVDHRVGRRPDPRHGRSRHLIDGRRREEEEAERGNVVRGGAGGGGVAGKRIRRGEEDGKA